MTYPDLSFDTEKMIATMDVPTPPPGANHEPDPVPHGIRQANARGFAAIGVWHSELGTGLCRFTFKLSPLKDSPR